MQVIMGELKTNQPQTDWEKRAELRGKFVGRAKQYLEANPHARQQLAKSFGKSITKVDSDEIVSLFEVLTDEIYEEENLSFSSNNKLEAYFFVLTMMAYDAKKTEKTDDVRMEEELRTMYHKSTTSESTKRKIRTLIGSHFGSNGEFQKHLASLVKQMQDRNGLNYIRLLQDLCNWNWCNGESNVSNTCQRWSKTIFLSKEEL